LRVLVVVLLFPAPENTNYYCQKIGIFHLPVNTKVPVFPKHIGTWFLDNQPSMRPYAYVFKEKV